jgi:DNA repair exonuclease SbcCD nuclease subunit
MRILVTSDWHLDASTAGYERFDDISAAADRTVELAISQGCDMYMFLGDLCDPSANRAPRCIAKAIEIERRLQRANIVSIWLTGNHDVIEDGSGTSTLTPLAAAGAIVHDTPFVADSGSSRFVFLPFVPRVRDYDAAEFVRSVGNLDRDEKNLTVVLAGHLMIPELAPGSETIDMPRGRDMRFPVNEAAQLWGDKVLMLNGHYHRRVVEGRGVYGGGLIIPGSLERLTFGEEDNTPGVVIVEVNDAS